MRHPEGSVSREIVERVCAGGAADTDARMKKREPSLHALARREHEALLRLARKEGLRPGELEEARRVAALLWARLYEALELGHAAIWKD